MSQQFEGVTDAYKPPVMDYDNEPARAGGSGAIYVVSPTKVLVLGLATFGIYSLYWFYKHWSLQRRAYGLAIWPIPRAIFSVFFTHQLFKAFHTQAAERGDTPSWQPNSQATLYVVLTIASNLIGRVEKITGEHIALDLGSIVLGLAAMAPLVAAQKVANAAGGDPEGRSNASYSAGNVVVLILGGLVWAAAGFGFAGYGEPSP